MNPKLERLETLLQESLDAGCSYQHLFNLITCALNDGDITQAEGRALLDRPIRRPTSATLGSDLKIRFDDPSGPTITGREPDDD